jgi:hypothetical protein
MVSSLIGRTKGYLAKADSTLTSLFPLVGKGGGWEAVVIFLGLGCPIPTSYSSSQGGVGRPAPCRNGLFDLIVPTQTFIWI